jgi:hypothetical protein
VATKGLPDVGQGCAGCRVISPEQINKFRNKLAIIKGRADLLTIDGHATDSSRNAGRIIGQATREIEELLGLPGRSAVIEEAVAREQLKRL